MARSLKNNGETGAVNMALRLISPILLNLRTKVKLNDAFKTSIENSLIHCGSFLNGSKANRRIQGLV
jgi:hypothetical protein